MGMPITPADVSSVPTPVPADFEKPYQDAIASAHSNYLVAFKNFLDAKTALAAIPAPAAGTFDTQADIRTHAQTVYDAAAKVLESAGALETKAHTDYAVGVDRYVSSRAATPGLTAHYQALADSARATAAKVKAETDEALTTAPDRIAQAHATRLEAEANLAVAQAKADVAGATTDIEKAAAQTKLDQANANLESTQKANTQAGLQNRITAAKADVAPRVETAAATTAEAGATTASANAANAVQTSAANLQKTQADANRAELDYKTAQANFDALSPEMRTQAAQAELDTKKTAAAQAQQALQLAQDTHDTVVAQGKATLEATQAGTQKGLLGSMYGLQDRVKAIADMYRSGELDHTPEGLAKGRALLQDYIDTAVQGTTPFERSSTGLAAETTRRQQDYSLAGQQMSALGSAGSSLFGSMASINKDAPAGSTALATGYGGVMGALYGAFQGMKPNIPADSALLQSMRPNSSVTPTTTIAPDGTVTIQHAGGAPDTSNPSLMGTGITGPSSGTWDGKTAAFLTPAAPTATDYPGGYQGAPNPNPFGSGMGDVQAPAMLTGTQLGTPAHVDAQWADDPNLHPELAQAAAGAG